MTSMMTMIVDDGRNRKRRRRFVSWVNPSKPMPIVVYYDESSVSCTMTLPLAVMLLQHLLVARLEEARGVVMMTH